MTRLAVVFALVACLVSAHTQASSVTSKRSVNFTPSWGKRADARLVHCINEKEEKIIDIVISVPGLCSTSPPT